MRSNLFFIASYDELCVFFAFTHHRPLYTAFYLSLSIFFCCSSCNLFDGLCARFLSSHAFTPFLSFCGLHTRTFFRLVGYICILWIMETITVAWTNTISLNIICRMRYSNFHTQFLGDRGRQWDRNGWKKNARTQHFTGFFFFMCFRWVFRTIMMYTIWATKTILTSFPPANGVYK